MKRSGVFLVFVGLLAFFTFFLARPLQAVPITLKIDNPNQIVFRPVDGVTVVNFTGTVTIGRGFSFEEAILDFDYDGLPDDGLPTSLGSLRLSKANNGGSVSGILFTALVSSSTNPGFYGFKFGGRDPAEFTVEVSNGRRFVTSSETFSVRVVVADTGSTLLLSAACFGLLLLWRHAAKG